MTDEQPTSFFIELYKSQIDTEPSVSEPVQEVGLSASSWFQFDFRQQALA
jgi:hypothetical protein